MAVSADARQIRNQHLTWYPAVAAPAAAAPFAIVERPGWQQIDADMHNLRAGLA